MSELTEKCTLARDAAQKLLSVSTAVKDRALDAIADALVERTDEIIAANELDLKNAEENGLRKSMMDRLRLTPERIKGIADGVREVRALRDPIGEVTGMWTRPNGLQIGRRRVPMGVIAIIYEARPNVTVDAAALCLKRADGTLLRGGTEAVKSKTARRRVMQGGG